MSRKESALERWARQWCTVIESRGVMALSPEPISSEWQSSAEPAKEKHTEASSLTISTEPEETARFEKQFEITGTRVIMPEDRVHLDSEVKLLKPAFDALSEHINASARSSEEHDLLFQKLGEIVSASYYIGAYTTVSLGAQQFVTPAVLREKVKTPQRAKAVTDMQRRERLRAAIENAAGGRPLKGSIAFAELIRGRVLQHLGPSTGTWPSAKTITTEIQAMNRERRRENKEAND